MYTVCVRDHMMIAHSFAGEVFGPAQRLHGATYVVDVEFRARELDKDGIAVDIGLAGEALRGVMNEMNYRNFDEEAAFAGRNTTTEVVAKTVFDRMLTRIFSGELGPAALSLVSLRVCLHESHVAWAAYEGEVNAAS